MVNAYIGRIEISARVAEKIQSKHGVTPDDVRDACQSPSRYQSAFWHEDPERGSRLIVVGTTREGRVIKVTLFPVEFPAGTWRLGTALVARG